MIGCHGHATSSRLQSTRRNRRCTLDFKSEMMDVFAGTNDTLFPRVRDQLRIFNKKLACRSLGLGYSELGDGTSMKFSAQEDLKLPQAEVFARLSNFETFERIAIKRNVRVSQISQSNPNEDT